MSAEQTDSSPLPAAAPAAAASSSRAAPAAASSVSASSSEGAGPIICPGHSRPVPDLAFTNDTPDGYFLVSACLDNKAMLRDGSTGDWIGTFVGHKGAVWCARLNAAATQAATAAADFSVKLWDALSGAEMHTLQHKHIVKSVCFSADSTRLYSGGAEKKLRIWDLSRPDAAAAELTDHAQTISQVLTTADENLIVTGAAEKDIRIWDRRTRTVAQRLQTSGDVRGAQTTLDGAVLSVATGGKEVSFYSTDNWSLIKRFTMPREIDTVSYDPVHQRFITGCMTELWVRCYDFNSGEEIACNKGHHGPVRSLAFAPSFDSYASGSEDGTIRIWSWAGQGLAGVGGVEDGMAGLKVSANKDDKERAVEKK